MKSLLGPHKFVTAYTYGYNIPFIKTKCPFVPLNVFHLNSTLSDIKINISFGEYLPDTFFSIPNSYSVLLCLKTKYSKFYFLFDLRMCLLISKLMCYQVTFL